GVQAILTVALEPELAVADVGADAADHVGARDDLGRRRGVRSRRRWEVDASDAANALVVGIGDVHRAVRRQAAPVGAIERGLFRWAAVAAEAAHAGAGEGANFSVRSDVADTIVVRV